MSSQKHDDFNLKHPSQPTAIRPTFLMQIEIPRHTHVKYEHHPDGYLIVQRFLSSNLSPPGNYGYLRNTLGGDGTEIDALMLSEYSLVANSQMNVHIIGGVRLLDQDQEDFKILVVPHDESNSMMSTLDDLSSISPEILNRIEHFFQFQKDLESPHSVKIQSFMSASEALRYVNSRLISQFIFKKLMP